MLASLFTAGPWGRSDRIGLLAGGVVAAAMLLGAWIGAAAEADVESQVGYGVLAVGAVVVLFAAAIGWLVTGRRAVGLRRRHLLGADRTRPGAPQSSRSEADLVAVDGLRRYHRPSCPLVRERASRAAPRVEHETAGRAPCGVCVP